MSFANSIFPAKLRFSLNPWHHRGTGRMTPKN